MKIKPLFLVFLLLGSSGRAEECGEYVDQYNKKYKLAQLTTAEQRLVLIENDKNIVLLNLGEALFDQWTLRMVMNESAVFSCKSNHAVNIIIHKHVLNRPRPPDVIDVYHTPPDYLGLY